MPTPNNQPTRTVTIQTGIANGNDLAALQITGDDANPNTFYGTPFTTAIVDGVATFYVRGDLHIGSDTITVRGGKPLSIIVANDVIIAADATLDASAIGDVAGPGGGASGAVAAGGVGGFGGLGGQPGGAGGSIDSSMGMSGSFGVYGQFGLPGNAVSVSSGGYNNSENIVSSFQVMAVPSDMVVRRRWVDSEAPMHLEPHRLSLARTATVAMPAAMDSMATRAAQAMVACYGLSIIPS